MPLPDFLQGRPPTRINGEADDSILDRVSATKLLLPNVPQFDEALALAARYPEDPEAGMAPAWEAAAAAGLIPEAWVDDDARRFAWSTPRTNGVIRITAAPVNRAGFVSLVASAPFVVLAEALGEARRAAERPWRPRARRADAPRQRTWWTGAAPQVPSSFGEPRRAIATLLNLAGERDFIERAIRAARAFLDDAGALRVERARVVRTGGGWSFAVRGFLGMTPRGARPTLAGNSELWRALADALRGDLLGDLLWRRAEALDLIVPADRMGQDTRVAALPNPYAPALDLWQTGMAPGRRVQESLDFIVPTWHLE